MKLKFIDVILIVVILGSAGFIGYRFLRANQKPTTPAQPVAASNNATAPARPPRAVPRPAPRVGPPLFSTRFHNFLSSIPPVSEPVWSNLLARPELKKFSVTQTDRCAENPKADSNGLYLVVPFLLDGYQKGLRTLFIDVGSKRCFKVGEKVLVGSYTDNPTEPVISMSGRIEVIGLLSVPYDQISNTMAASIGILKSEMDQVVLRPGRSLSYPVTFVRFGKFEPAKPLADRPPPAFLRYSVVSGDEIKAMKREGKAILIVDVRNAAEASKSSLPNSVNLPVVVADPRFKWNFPVSDLNQIKLDLTPVTQWRSKLQDPKKSAVIVVGENPTDGRPLWALPSFLKVEAEDVYWFYDGASSLETALK